MSTTDYTQPTCATVFTYTELAIQSHCQILLLLSQTHIKVLPYPFPTLPGISRGPEAPKWIRAKTFGDCYNHVCFLVAMLDVTIFSQ